MSVYSSDNTPLSKDAIKRLQQDNKELIKEPIIGASAAISGDNIKYWHCNIKALSGPYKDITIHFALEFPYNYPQKAPHAYFITKIKYASGADVIDSKGRQIICLDLFGNFSSVHTEWGKDNVASGWSPAYTIKTILINVQAVLLGNQYLSQNEKDILMTKKSSELLECTDCGHTQQEPFPEFEDESSIIELKNEYNPSDNIKCYVYGTKFTESIIGYGISINRKIISTPAEYLSLKAYNNNTRTSTLNKTFTHWLPCFINNDNWKKVEKYFLLNIKKIYQSVYKNNNANNTVIVFTVLSSIMNSMVVEVMQLDKSLHASDKFIDSYFNCYRILNYYMNNQPLFSKGIDTTITKFINGNTNKTNYPDLGQFIISLLVSKKYTWNDISNKFIQEVDTRNVFWYVKGNRYNYPKHPELISISRNQNRANKVFNATRISRNLICFQTKFIELSKSIDIDILDKNYGVVNDDIKQTIKSIHKTVNSMVSWKEYFEWNKLTYISEEIRNKQLEDALQKSSLNKYH